MDRVRHRIASGGGRLRAYAAVLVVAAVGAVFVVVGARGGYPAEQPRLLSGAAWLPSSQVGQLTLLDGSSAEVAAQVQVAGRGERLVAAQHGTTGYAVNQSAGSIRRVDGASFGVSATATLIPDAGDGLLVLSGPQTLYALDTRRGVLTSADAGTLGAHGPPVPMAPEIAAQGAVLDEDGRLWLLNPATGDLVRVENGRREIRRGAASPGAGILALAGGQPVLIDTARRTAIVIDRRSGAARGRTALDVAPADRVLAGGARHAARLYLLAARGLLTICDLDAGSCPNAVPLDTGADVGPPIEAGGHVFIPDYATGRVLVIDPEQARVIAHPSVLDPGRRFQLLTHDGVVFYNDPDSERAGVITLSGGVRAAAKYDPKNPEKGLRAPDPTPSPSGAKSSPTSSPPANPSSPPRENPGTTPSQPAGPSCEARIVLSRPSSPVDEDVTLDVAVSGGCPQPAAAQWNFGDGQTDDRVPTTHRWATARIYQVSVRVTLADRRTVVASTPFEVTPVAPVTGRLVVAVTGPGSVTSEPAGISCPPACEAAFPADATVRLTAGGSASDLTGWGGDCAGAGTDPVCQLTVPATGAAASVAFATRPSVAVEVIGGGVVTGPGISCPPTCSNEFPLGARVTLTASPRAGFQLKGWGGSCTGQNQNPTCEITVPAAGARVSAAFTALPRLTVSVIGSGTVMGGDILCPPTCTVFLPASTRITLNASAAAGNQFKAWGGACGGAVGSCTVILNGDRSVTAEFESTHVTMPRVIGMQEAAAVDRLERLGLRVVVGDQTDPSCNSLGHVMSQDPAAGQGVRRGSTVTITVGRKPSPPRVCP